MRAAATAFCWLAHTAHLCVDFNGCAAQVRASISSSRQQRRRPRKFDDGGRRSGCEKFGSLDALLLMQITYTRTERSHKTQSERAKFEKLKRHLLVQTRRVNKAATNTHSHTLERFARFALTSANFTLLADEHL